MPLQKIYISDSGQPATGLTPVWDNLKKASDGTDYLPQPAISEIGGGWYKFTQPDISEDLTGVIDGGAALTSNADRYIPVDITPDDFGMTDILDVIIKGSQELDPTTDTLTLKRRDGVTVLVTFDLVKTSESIGAYKARSPQ